MNVDELLADPLTALQLPDNVVPVHAIIIVDYVDPETGTRSLTGYIDDDLPPWAMRGMLIESYDVISATHPCDIRVPGEDDEDE